MERDGSELYLELTSGDSVRCQRCGRGVDFTQRCMLSRSGQDGRCWVTKCSACMLATESDTERLFADVVGSLVEVFGIERTRAEIARSLLPKASGDVGPRKRKVVSAEATAAVVKTSPPIGCGVRMWNKELCGDVGKLSENAERDGVKPYRYLCDGCKFKERA